MCRANILLKAAPTAETLHSNFQGTKNFNINTSDVLVMSICMSKTHTYYILAYVARRTVCNNPKWHKHQKYKMTQK